MKRSIKVPWGNLRVGLLLTFALAMLVWASLGGGGTSIFQPKNDYTTYFRNVNGLLKGSPVWMSGLEVGNVRSIKFVALDSLRQLEVVFRVRSDIRQFVTPGSHVQIGTIGFLGDKYVDIIPGPPSSTSIPPGTVIPSAEAGDAAAMFKEGQQAMVEVRGIVRGLDSLVGRINRGEGSLGKLAKDSTLAQNLTALSGQLVVLTRGLEQDRPKITAVATSVDSLIRRINAGKGTLSRLVEDSSLYLNLASTSARLDSVTAKLNSAKGSLGLLASDTAMYVETVNLLARVNNLITQIEKDPKQYFKFSVF